MSIIEAEKLKIALHLGTICTILSCTFYLGTIAQKIIIKVDKYDQYVLKMDTIYPKIESIAWIKQRVSQIDCLYVELKEHEAEDNAYRNISENTRSKKNARSSY